MSLAQGATFESVLKGALEEAGLPTDPKEIIGKAYMFCSEYGSHHCILCGTISSLSLSDTGGLELFVTNPRIGSDRLKGIARLNGQWLAITLDPTNGSPSGPIIGELKLL